MTDIIQEKRKEYELTTEQYDKLIEACRSTPLIMLQCGMPSSPQENANRAWCALGKELGFDGMSVEASRKGKRFFTAIPSPSQSDGQQDLVSPNQ